MKKRYILPLLCLLSLVLSACGGQTSNKPSVSPTATTAGATATATTVLQPGQYPTVKVVGNQLENGAGKPIRLFGVDVSADDCIPRANSTPTVLADGPSDTAAEQALARWPINTVRITTKEDCWLGINGLPVGFSASVYQTTIENFVHALNSYGIYVIIDLHNGAPGTTPGMEEVQQYPIADADHAPTYWTSVATMFKNDPAVIFEPYNEPNIISPPDSRANTSDPNPWDCWLNGCTMTTTNPPWHSAGMQQLVNTIRATGAKNVISLSGLHLANDLSGFLHPQYLPKDPLNQLTATFHNYGRNPTQNEGCGPGCWNNVIAPVAAKMPVLTDEFGEPNCQTSNWVTPYMDWADQHGVSYLAWIWETWGCAPRGYGLLSDWNGTPNSYGLVLYKHFQTQQVIR